MSRADFYLIAKPRFLTEPLRLVCELARKARTGQSTWSMSHWLSRPTGRPVA